MISLAPGTKVFLACRPIDMRSGFNGLAAKARQVIGQDPFSGHLFLCPACLELMTAPQRSHEHDWLRRLRWPGG